MINLFETNRCIVRTFIEDDILKFIAYRNDENWMKYQNSQKLSEEEYRTFLLNNYSLDDGEQFAIIGKDKNDFLGDIYLKKVGDVLNINYTINPKYARKGFIFEVLSELINWSKNKEIKRIVGDVIPDDIASINLLKKLNFKAVGILNYGSIITDEKVVVYELCL